jgi:hypothetical protein
VTTRLRRAAIALAGALLLVPAAAAAQTPDPMARGPHTVAIQDPFKAGTVNLQEPNSGGGAPTGGSAAATLEVRGSLYYPADRPTPAPVIVLVHGNHASCDTGSAPNCTAFKRNDRGYAYLGENLASHGYAVVSLDQDQLIAFQDGVARGMHQRRLLIAAALDALFEANQQDFSGTPDTLGTALVGKLDMTKIGLMGHSRGGDAVSSFVDYNRTRPEPGRRYPLSAVIALAPTDYERRAPVGVPFATILPLCDGDVSNLQGARLFERGQRLGPDAFPRVQFSVHGTNHNWYNSVWAADGEDTNATDTACSVRFPNNIRLSGGVSVPDQTTGSSTTTNDLGWSGGGTYTRNNRGSGDPALMGDNEKVGLALMSAFFRRYVGREVGFDPYVTGERTAAGDPLLPVTACPSQKISGIRNTGTTQAPVLTPEATDGTRIPCSERMLTSYVPGDGERLDILGPEPETPLTASALGTAVSATGFSNPFTPDGGVDPVPATTSNGLDWCNPEPDHFTPGALGYPGLPTAQRPCPLPGINALGGQNNGARENAPVNRSYGLQLALAWQGPASLSVGIPSARQDLTGFKALAMQAAVNFFDPRNPARTPAALWNPAALTQDFEVVMTDGAGRTASVRAAEQRYGNALHPTVGDTTAKVHVLLNQIRIPLADFAAKGLDLKDVASLTLRFGGAGLPATGSIQLSDVRVQEAATGPTVLTGRTGEVTPEAVLAAVPRAAASPAVPDVLALRPGCGTRAPVLGIARATASGRRMTVRGTAAGGCAAVRSVQVSVARRTAAGCRVLRASGRLSRPLPCSGRLALVARGTSAWSLRTARLPRGTYLVTVRALDARGTVSAARRLRVRVA